MSIENILKNPEPVSECDIRALVARAIANDQFLISGLLAIVSQAVSINDEVCLLNALVPWINEHSSSFKATPRTDVVCKRKS